MKAGVETAGLSVQVGMRVEPKRCGASLSSAGKTVSLLWQSRLKRKEYGGKVELPALHLLLLSLLKGSCFFGLPDMEGPLAHWGALVPKVVASKGKEAAGLTPPE